MEPIKFKLFGFAIEVHGGFLLFLGVMSLFQLEANPPIHAIVWCAVLALAFVTHELGHAFVARAFGLKVMPIELRFMVGTTPHQRTTPGKQLLISVAGPAAGLALGVVGLAVISLVPMSPSTLAFTIFEDVLLINVVLSLFNLLPIVPLDGGNALRSGLELIWGHTVAWKAVSVISVVLGLAIMIFGFQSGMLLLASMAGFAVWLNFQRLRELGVV